METGRVVDGTGWVPSVWVTAPG